MAFRWRANNVLTLNAGFVIFYGDQVSIHKTYPILTALLFSRVGEGVRSPSPLSGSVHAFANSVDPDKMSHRAIFYQGLHCLLEIKSSFRDITTSQLRISTCDPHKAQNGLSRFLYQYIWASMRENLSGVCKQHRRRPVCASVQFDQRLFYSFFLTVSYINLLQVKFQFSS